MRVKKCGVEFFFPTKLHLSNESITKYAIFHYVAISARKNG